MFIFQAQPSILQEKIQPSKRSATTTLPEAKKTQAMTIIQDGVAKGKTNNEIVKTLIGMDFKVQGSDETGKIVFPPDMIFVPKNIAFNKEKSFALNVIGVGNYNVDTNEKTVNNEVAKTKEDITQRLGLCNNDNVRAMSAIC